MICDCHYPNRAIQYGKIDKDVLNRYGLAILCGIKPDLTEHGPALCSYHRCPQFTGERCRLLDARPGRLCEPYYRRADTLLRYALAEITNLGNFLMESADQVCKLQFKIDCDAGVYSAEDLAILEEQYRERECGKDPP